VRKNEQVRARAQNDTQQPTVQRQSDNMQRKSENTIPRATNNARAKNIPQERNIYRKSEKHIPRAKI
jgi:hypothetical protein